MLDLRLDAGGPERRGCDWRSHPTGFVGDGCRKRQRHRTIRPATPLSLFFQPTQACFLLLGIALGKTFCDVSGSRPVGGAVGITWVRFSVGGYKRGMSRCDDGIRFPLWMSGTLEAEGSLPPEPTPPPHTSKGKLGNSISQYYDVMMRAKVWGVCGVIEDKGERSRNGFWSFEKKQATLLLVSFGPGGVTKRRCYHRYLERLS